MSTSAAAQVPVDPDVDQHAAAQRRRALDPLVLAVIAAGGVAGSEARYALHLWSSGADGTWPWGTWWANVAGSLLLGALMVVLTELTSSHRLVRPFLGVGVLGGFTTFSTVMVETPDLMSAGRPGLALGYLVGTAGTALAAVAAGSLAVRAAAAGWRRLWRRRPR